MSELKRCSKCGEEKTATREFFYGVKTATDGLHSWCKVCVRQYSNSRHAAMTQEQQKAKSAAAYKNRNVERENAQRRAKYAENLEAARASSKARCKKYYWSNPEKRRQAALDRRNANLQEFRAKEQVWSKNWRLRNPLISRAAINRRGARRRALTIEGGFTGKDLNDLFAKQRGLCHYCERKVGGKHGIWEVDHFIPVSRGGSNFPENLVIACFACNRSKNAKMPWEWMPERFSPPDAQATD